MSGSPKSPRAQRATSPSDKQAGSAEEPMNQPAPERRTTEPVVKPAAGERAPVGALRRLARRPAPPALLEHCDFCGAALPPEHRHLLDRTAHTLACACTACALLFEREGAAGGKYITIPQRYLSLRGFRLSDALWDDLMIPVNMAFIYYSSTAERAVAYYPSPAGATESLLSMEHWQTLVQENAALADLAPNVEALLINRLGEARDYYIAPIDACYQLVGVIRTTWRGLGGGAEAWEAITGFFAGLSARSEVIGGATGDEAEATVGASKGANGA